jgi:hypothetical protein
MQAAYDVISAAEATLSHQSSLAPSVSEIIDAMVKRWIDEKWSGAFREDCERLVDATGATMCQPAAAKTNASAEARLREALKTARDFIEFYGLDDFEETTNEAIRSIDEALSAHPHASDCDKQGER